MAYFLVLMQFQAFSRPGAVPAAELAALTVHLSDYYGVDPQLAAAIILAESGGRAHAINKHTHDYGLMQINEKLASDMRINKICLMDWKCNMTFGILHLSKLKRPCMYNLGRNRIIGTRYEAACNRYEQKLANFVAH